MDKLNKRIFDRLADTYHNDKFDERVLRTLVNWMGLKPGMKVLEVGSGHGDFTPFLLEAIGENGAVCLLDISQKMIDLAKRKLKPQFPSHGLLFSVADIAEFDILENSFDAVVCFNCFPHFSDKPMALANCFRLLKNGGRIIICHDRSRKEIDDLHARHGVSRISQFPNESEMPGLIRDSGLNLEKLVNSNIYFLRAYKPRTME